MGLVDTSRRSDRLRDRDRMPLQTPVKNDRVVILSSTPVGNSTAPNPI